MVFKKRSKFNNKITRRGSSIYHSKAEAKYATILQNLLKEGHIDFVAEQVRYPLPNMTGQMRLAYIADFVVRKGTEEWVIDVKGLVTPDMVVKMSYFTFYYKRPVKIVYSSGLQAYDTSFLRG